MDIEKDRPISYVYSSTPAYPESRFSKSKLKEQRERRIHELMASNAEDASAIEDLFRELSVSSSNSQKRVSNDHEDDSQKNNKKTMFYGEFRPNVTLQIKHGSSLTNPTLKRSSDYIKLKRDDEEDMNESKRKRNGWFEV